MSREITAWTQQLLLSPRTRSTPIPPPLDVIPCLTRLRRGLTPTPIGWSIFTGPRESEPWSAATILAATGTARITRAPLVTWAAPTLDEPSRCFRLALWPRGIPRGPYLGILSSRLRRDLAEHRDWFAALRELDEQLATDTVLVTAQSTTPFPFLQRLTARRSRRLVAIYLPPSNLTTGARWWRYASSLDLPHHDAVFPLLLSPLLPLPSPGDATRTKADGPLGGATPPGAAPIPGPGPFPLSHSRLTPTVPPPADRHIAQFADQLVVLRLRRPGRLVGWIRGLAARATVAGKPVWIAAGPGLVAPDLAQELVEQGAHWWRSFAVRKRFPLETLVQGLRDDAGLEVELPHPLHAAGGWAVARPEP